MNLIKPFKVEQTHIDNGIRGNCQKCPVALAILDLFDQDDKFQFTSEELDVSIEICGFSIMLSERPYIEYGSLSPGVEDFIDGFDWEKEDIVPTEMKLDIEKGIISLQHEA